MCYLNESINVLKDTTVHTTMIKEATMASATFASFSTLEMRFPIRMIYNTDGKTDAVRTEEKLPIRD